MRLNILFVLLLATGVALAADEPESEVVAGAAEAQGQKEETQGTKEDGQGQKEEVQEENEDDQGETPAVKTKTQVGPKLISGMSILGNQEAPKSLVIVPWKSSELGDSIGISPMLDDSRQPIDRAVFLRALMYYQIRSGTKP
jgi:hypothetical protein